MMDATRMIRCRFCEFATPAFKTGRGGTRRSGFTRLAAHIEREHPDEAAKLEEAIEEAITRRWPENKHGQYELEF